MYPDLVTLSIIRSSKLDIAQWIASGVRTCSESAVSRSLCLYAAEQLETSAMIPVPFYSGQNGTHASQSLLRTALRSHRVRTGAESIALLATVSRVIGSLLVKERNKPDQTAESRERITKLIERERRSLSRLKALQSAVRLRAT